MTVLDFFTLIRRGWRVLLIGAIAGVLVGVGYFFLTPKVYEARATGFIASSSEESLVSGSDEATARASSYVALITSGTVREAIAEELHMPTENLLTPEHLRRVAWQPPTELTAEAIASALAELGARPWQVAHTAQKIADAFVEGPQTAVEGFPTAS